MFRKITILSALVAICLAQARSGPYPPSGWKPQGAPFILPKEFLPQQNQQDQPQQTEVEITQEHVDYAGQLSETTTQYPSNSYLPPAEGDDDNSEESSTEDYLKVQGLPSNQPASFNNNQPGSGQLNREYGAPARNQYRTQNNRQFGQVRQQQQFGQAPQQQQQQQRQQFGQKSPQQQEQQFGQAPQQQQFRQRQVVRQDVQQFPVPRQNIPATKYGPPTPDNENAEPTSTDQPQNPGADDNSEEDEEQQPPAIAVSNSVSNGRYYILTPDNTLQRVVFMTTQTEDEARTNGFTAELRYMPVEPIRDAIYAYNGEGQLVRIYNKK